MSQPAVTPTLTEVPVEESRTTFRPYLVPDEVDVAGEVAQAWIDYKREACPARREQLILHYAPLVAAVASRVATRLPSSVEHADLVSYGMFGLIDAIEKFELDREIKFETYASSRIRGAIIDELRSIDWLPRSVRTKARAIDRAHSELEAIHHRSPQESEVAAQLGVQVEEVRAVRTQVASANVVALDELLSIGAEQFGQVSAVDATHQSRTNDPARTFEAKETKFLLSQAIGRLSDREKLVLTFYYFQNMTLAEIGTILGVTESRISQMHTAAMSRLRDLLVAAEHA